MPKLLAKLFMCLMSAYLCNEMEGIHIAELKQSFQILKTVSQVKLGRSTAMAAPSTKPSWADGCGLVSTDPGFRPSLTVHSRLAAEGRD